MYIPTDVDLAELAQAVELVDKLFDKMGEAETYEPKDDDAIHYQLAEVSDTLRFSILQPLLKRKELI